MPKNLVLVPKSLIYILKFLSTVSGLEPHTNTIVPRSVLLFGFGRRSRPFMYADDQSFQPTNQVQLLKRSTTSLSLYVFASVCPRQINCSCPARRRETKTSKQKAGNKDQRPELCYSISFNRYISSVFYTVLLLLSLTSTTENGKKVTQLLLLTYTFSV